MCDYKEGDRVIYDGCPCIIIKGVDDRLRLDPIEWDKDYPYLNTWVHEDLITIDYQYYRNKKIDKILSCE